ncbi:MAG: hypothetical protein GVY02_00190 [Bacteroidetes bacterium]|jgi:hypothetical protein|nr:hypothetical protein [Bacteroidota bacterium]
MKRVFPEEGKKDKGTKKPCESSVGTCRRKVVIQVIFQQENNEVGHGETAMDPG